MSVLACRIELTFIYFQASFSNSYKVTVYLMGVLNLFLLSFSCFKVRILEPYGTFQVICLNGCQIFYNFQNFCHRKYLVARRYCVKLNTLKLNTHVSYCRKVGTVFIICPKPHFLCVDLTPDS